MNKVHHTKQFGGCLRMIMCALRVYERTCQPGMSLCVCVSMIDVCLCLYSLPLIFLSPCSLCDQTSQTGFYQQDAILSVITKESSGAGQGTQRCLSSDQYY